MDILWAYLTYLVVSVALTVWVATSLHRHGHVFLLDASHGRQDLAGSLGHLLRVGFHLVALGFILLSLPMPVPGTAEEAIEALSTKEGKVLLMLGAMHFFQLYILSRARRRALDDVAPPPVAPDGTVGAAA